MNQAASWYSSLIKPSWAPGAGVFGPVWTILYIIIAISFGYVAYLVIRKKIPFSVALPFILNLVFNLIYSPLQFGLQNLPLASLDILLVLGTLVWAIIVIYRHARWVSLVNIPYLAWVSFATILQFTILFLNLSSLS